MVRGKIVMKRIENVAKRLVTPTKRQNGLLLSYLFSVMSMLQLSSSHKKGRLYEFSSSNKQNVIERYFMYTKEIATWKLEKEQHMQPTAANSTLRFPRKNFEAQHLRIETANMFKKIEFLEVFKRKLLGQGLGSCSVKELQEIGRRRVQSLKNIGARKAQLYEEHIKELKAKERIMLKENAKLCQKMSFVLWWEAVASTANPTKESNLVAPKITSAWRL